MANIKGWRMVREDSGGEVYPGTTQLDHHGKEWKVLGAARAPEGASTGRVLVEDADGRKDGFYPQVFGLKIVPAEPDPEGVEELFASLAEAMPHDAEEITKDVVMEQIADRAEAWGCEVPDAILTMMMHRISACMEQTLSATLMAARELGRREGLAEAREGK